MLCVVFFFQAEDGIRDLVRSRGLGDVYKRQAAGDVPAITSDKFSHQVRAKLVKKVVTANGRK